MSRRIKELRERYAANQDKALTGSSRERESSASFTIFENQKNRGKRTVEGDLLRSADVLLSPMHAAEYLDVSRKFVYELIARREIDVVAVGGRLKRIRLSALEYWLTRREQRRR